MERLIKTKECWLFFSLTVLGIGPRILYILDKLSTTKSHTHHLWPHNAVVGVTFLRDV